MNINLLNYKNTRAGFKNTDEIYILSQLSVYCLNVFIIQNASMFFLLRYSYSWMPLSILWISWSVISNIFDYHACVGFQSEGILWHPDIIHM